jgi:hypothetical protein
MPRPNVSRRLGRTDPSITACTHSHVVKAEREAADALERMLPAAGSSSPLAEVTSLPLLRPGVAEEGSLWWPCLPLHRGGVATIGTADN